MATLTLHTYWRSSCSYRVRIALGHKGLAYEPVYVNILEGEQKSDAYREKNPIGHVPTLTVDGVAYVESVAIMELLDDLYPERPLLPKRPEDRARVRALVETINAGVQPLQNLAVLAKIGDDKEKRTEWLRFWMSRGLAAFEALVARFESEAGAKGPFAFGDALTMADACLVPQVYAARRFGVDLTPFPRIVRADAAATALAYVASARPEAQADAKPDVK
ncbi:MAG: maleylacetoacetate isomerase [Labilithrix sp.]|nr:maleylacetoacetate isomerase [Labilithrix sp.]